MNIKLVMTVITSYILGGIIGILISNDVPDIIINIASFVLLIAMVVLAHIIMSKELGNE